MNSARWRTENQLELLENSKGDFNCGSWLSLAAAAAPLLGGATALGVLGRHTTARHWGTTSDVYYLAGRSTAGSTPGSTAGSTAGSTRGLHDLALPRDADNLSPSSTTASAATTAAHLGWIGSGTSIWLERERKQRLVSRTVAIFANGLRAAFHN